MQLALDTSTAWSSVSVMDGDHVVAVEDISGVNPGEVVVSQIDRLLRSADVERTALDLVVVGVGPGPYTSTRIGVAIARTVGFALGIDVVGVCSLDAIAAEFLAATSVADGDFVVATDARRREVYWASYDSQGRRLGGPTVGKPADVVAAHVGHRFVGDGLNRYPDLVVASDVQVLAPSHPCARWVAAVAAEALAQGHVVPTTQPSLADHAAGSSQPFDPGQRLFAPFPLYLRRPDAIPAASVVSR